MIQTAFDQSVLLILISVGLGACFVWAFWEIEETRRRLQRQRELVHAARRAMRPSP